MFLTIRILQCNKFGKEVQEKKVREISQLPYALTKQGEDIKTSWPVVNGGQPLSTPKGPASAWRGSERCCPGGGGRL